LAALWTGGARMRIAIIGDDLILIRPGIERVT